MEFEDKQILTVMEYMIDEVLPWAKAHHITPMAFVGGNVLFLIDTMVQHTTPNKDKTHEEVLVATIRKGFELYQKMVDARGGG
jgi:hypothetical protein